MEDRVSNIEKELAQLVAEFQALVKNTDNLPELLRLLAVTAERSDVNMRDISATSKKTAILEDKLPKEIQRANDRANNTSRWVLGISLMYSTSLFGYFIFDMGNFKTDMTNFQTKYAIHEKRIVTIESRYNFLGLKNYD